MKKQLKFSLAFIKKRRSTGSRAPADFLVSKTHFVRKKITLTSSYTLVILRVMKTAISLPDALYSDAEKIAQSMGIPRSQLFAKALEEFIVHHKKETITERLNTVYRNIDQNIDILNSSVESIRRLTKDDAW